MRRSVLVAVALLAAALPALAQARPANVIVGVGDQHASMFSDASWKALGLRYTRYFVPYDAMSTPKALAKADAFVAAARAANVQVLLHVSTNDYGRKTARLPSVAEYRTKVGALITHFRAMGVNEFGAWNEVNNQTEPTYKSPARAAQFYLAMKAMCRGCTIVALDALDQGGVATYIDKWFKALPRKERAAKLIVGIHDYGDVNRFRTKGTRAIITAARKHARRATFWLTETGGLAQLEPNFPCDERRQARATKNMFAIIKTFDKDLDRAYSYNWYGTDCKGFDSGLVSASGAPRPAYNAFKAGLQGVRRR